MQRQPSPRSDLSGRHTPAPGVRAPQPAPRLVRQPDYARLGIDDPEGRN